MRAETIYKIVPRMAWEQASGSYQGSAHDRTDGFLHFSTWAQLPDTLRLYYAGQDDLMLVAVDAAMLGETLKWEHSPSRGEDFPHLFAALPFAAVAWTAAIIKDGTGNFVLPTPPR
jgi:uncharacterized protein (DUF952 family)